MPPDNQAPEQPETTPQPPPPATTPDEKRPRKRPQLRLLVGLPAALLLVLILMRFPSAFVEFRSAENDPKLQVITAETIEQAAQTQAPFSPPDSFRSGVQGVFQTTADDSAAKQKTPNPGAAQDDQAEDQTQQIAYKATRLALKSGLPAPVTSGEEKIALLEKQLPGLGDSACAAQTPATQRETLRAWVDGLTSLAQARGLQEPTRTKYATKDPETLDKLYALAANNKLSVPVQNQALWQAVATLQSEIAKYEAGAGGETTAIVGHARSQTATLVRAGEVEDRSIQNAPSEEAQKTAISSAIESGIRHSPVPSVGLVLAGIWLSGILLELASVGKKRAKAATEPGEVNATVPATAETSQAATTGGDDNKPEDLNLVSVRRFTVAIGAALLGLLIVLVPAFLPSLAAWVTCTFANPAGLFHGLRFDKEGLDQWATIAKEPSIAFIPACVIASFCFYVASNRLLDPGQESESLSSVRERAWEHLLPDSASAMAVAGLAVSGALIAPSLGMNGAAAPSVPAVQVQSGSGSGKGDRVVVSPGPDWAEEMQKLDQALKLTTAQIQTTSTSVATAGMAANDLAGKVKGLNLLTKEELNNSAYNARLSGKELSDGTAALAAFSAPSQSPPPKQASPEDTEAAAAQQISADTEQFTALPNEVKAESPANGPSKARDDAAANGLLSEQAYQASLVQESLWKSSSKYGTWASKAWAEADADKQALLVHGAAARLNAGKIVGTVKPKGPGK